MGAPILLYCLQWSNQPSLLTTACLCPCFNRRSCRPTIEQLWAHPWMRSGLARRSVVTAQGWQTMGPSIGPGDPFAATVESEIIKGAYRIDSKVCGGGAGR